MMKALTIKDLITTGIFSALYFIFVAVGALLGIISAHSGHMLLAPIFAALLCGTVYMLYIAKVPKFGGLTLIGLMMAIFFFLSGHIALSFLPTFLCGLMGDWIGKCKHYRNKWMNLVSYIVFSFGNMSPIIMMWIMREAYIERLLAKGKDMEYIQHVMIPFNSYYVLFFVGGIIISALIGGLFGQYLVKKHFVKAGMVHE